MDRRADHTCLDADQAVGCCTAAGGRSLTGWASPACRDGITRREGAGSHLSCEWLVCCSAGGGGAGSDGPGKITLVLIKGSNLQSHLACIFVVVRGRNS